MEPTIARRTAPLAALLLATGLALAACSSGDGAGSSSPSPSMSDSMASVGADQPEGASATVGDYDLTGFWVKESSLDMSAGFGTITNNSTEDDALIGATAQGVPQVELHQTVDNVMGQVDSFPIAAGGTLVLSPGGNHLMFIGLTQPLQVGATVDIALQFESGRTATITAPIEPFSGDDGHGDDGHGGGM